MSLISFNIAGSGPKTNVSDPNQVQALQILMNAALHYEQDYYFYDYPIEDLTTDGNYGPKTDELKNILFGTVPLYNNQLMSLAAAIPSQYLSDNDYATIAKYFGSYSPPATTPKPATTPAQTPATTKPAGSFTMASAAPLLAIAAAGLLLMDDKKKKVSGINAEEVKPWLFVAGGAIVLIYGTSIINQVMQVFHLSKGAGEKAVETEQSNPNSPWSPNFYKAAPAGSSLLTVAQAADLAATIWGALGYTYDDFDAIQGVFKQLQTQSQVSFLADIFQQNYYGTDLLSYLKDGGGSMPWDGLSDDHLKVLTSLVSNLPRYKP